MKTTNLDPSGDLAAARWRGHIGATRAGSTGITTSGGGTTVGGTVVLEAGHGLTVTDLTDGAARWDVDETLLDGSLIPGAGGATLPWLYAKADGGLAGDGVTDDTVALQALINTATGSGLHSGWIFFEPGTYLIGGALQDTGAFNGQILIPAGLPLAGEITLTLQGPARPAQGGGPSQSGMAVLRSSLTGASGTAAVFSAGNSTAGGTQVVIRDLLCVAKENPSLTFWNLLYTRDGLRQGLMITTDGAGFATQPTHSNAYGIKLPETNTSGHVVEEIIVQGFYTGIRHAELTWGDYTVWDCIRAVEIVFAYHTGGGFRLATLSCARGIVVTGANQLDIVYDAEHYSAAAHSGAPASYPTWSANVYDLDDGSNLLSGHIRWWGVAAFTGIDHVFQVNGATNVHYEEMGVRPDAQSVQGVAISGTPTSGQVPIASSGTAAAWGTPSNPGVTVLDEGTPLTTAGTTLNFVGAGVFASGSGATKTITIAGGAAALDDLSDVVITSAAAGDRLRYDGSNWVNSALRWEPHVAYDGTVVLNGNGDPVMVEQV